MSTRASLHPLTFDYLKPTDDEIVVMRGVRLKTLQYADYLDAVLPDGLDKTYVLRKLREINMWAMVALTRHGDGSPRQGD